jgi:hypothetical protein
MAENIPLTKIDLDFTLNNTPIDYFHIDSNVLSMGEFNVTEVDLNLQPGQYLTMEHLKTIDQDEKEIIVFNIPVGKGKQRDAMI